MRRSRSKKNQSRGEKPKIQRRREVSAGGLTWRRDADNSVSVVLVRPAGRKTWVLPKGHLEPGETVEEAAQREVREESGLTVGKIQPLGEISYVYSARERGGSTLTRIFKRVYFFLMEHTGGDTAAHDAEIEEVAWMSLADARLRATHESEQQLIAKAAGMLGVSCEPG
jgi:8-oxo-dGTP pyrophosphatase MutT (NUDIX family)